MIPLSRAIQRSDGPDPLEAALQTLRVDLRPVSPDSRPHVALRALYDAWPFLGASVQTFRKLADRLPRGIVAPYSLPHDRPASLVYNQGVHATLYRAITALHDRHDWTKDEIASLLADVRL